MEFSDAPAVGTKNQNMQSKLEKQVESFLQTNREIVNPDKAHISFCGFNQLCLSYIHFHSAVGGVSAMMT